MFSLQQREFSSIVGKMGIMPAAMSGDPGVPYHHVHIMPPWEDDRLTVSNWEMKAGDMDELQEIARKVQESLS